MPTGYRTTDEQREQILDDVRAGHLGRNAIARKHRVGLATVSDIARDAGLADAFDRSRTARATADRQADMRARRAQLAEDLLDDIERFRDQLFEACTVPIGYKDGVQMVELDHPDATAVRNLMTSIGVATDKHLALERHDSSQGHDGAKSMLVSLAEGLRAVQTAMDQETRPADT